MFINYASESRSRGTVKIIYDHRRFANYSHLTELQLHLKWVCNPKALEIMHSQGLFFDYSVLKSAWPNSKSTAIPAQPIPSSGSRPDPAPAR